MYQDYQESQKIRKKEPKPISVSNTTALLTFHKAD